ncbi:hypothetical protein ABOM_004152 [Aspergillus bombycis]|uniref:Uncharacterized protein n=1 Tax=Aspergillus bombycis TaxID=109264 RepID=A0A1F8ABX8_9EURO|nr:hypothetical protein ABOM_004152 [Aspergillus bombycis]OGM49246.1 hypothetical protein ABOM_004152 [Aspergillus bombycis]
MASSTNETMTSGDRRVPSGRLGESAQTTAQDWILEGQSPEALPSLYPFLDHELLQRNPVHGGNDGHTRGLCSTLDIHGHGIGFISSSSCLQAHDHSLAIDSSDLDDIALNSFEMLAATTEIKQTVQPPQKLLTESHILNNGLLNPDQRNRPGRSFIPARDQIVTLAAGNTMQNIHDPDHVCQCWRELTYILEKIELKDNTLETLEQSSIELALSFQRRAVEKCARIIACSYCRLSSERMMLLGLILEKLVMKFTDLVRVCQEKGLFQAHSDPHASSSDGQPSSSLVRSEGSASTSSRYSVDSTNTERRLFLGDYEVQPSEWAPLVKTLIRLYAKRLESLLRCCKMWAIAANQSAMLSIFSNVEQQFELMSAIV